MNTVVISPHPDDETLGCGGTLLKHKKNNDNIYWIIVTELSEKMGFNKNQINNRQQEIKKVSKEYSFNRVFQLEYSAVSLDTIPLQNLIEDVSNIFKNINPEIIYLPFRNDIHTDHRVVFDVVISCTKSFRYPSIKRVLAYETISETEFAPPLNENIFKPNCFSNISNFIDRKIEIMKIYKSEIREHPFPRSAKNIRALATFRGATAGIEYAEAFMVLKEII